MPLNAPTSLQNRFTLLTDPSSKPVQCVCVCVCVPFFPLLLLPKAYLGSHPHVDGHLISAWFHISVDGSLTHIVESYLIVESY